jgi:hypothetical protein
MKIKYNIPLRGEVYEIILNSKLLHKKFGENLRIKIQGPAQEIFGNNFMDLPPDIFGACGFYTERLRAGEIEDPEGEVYLGTIGLEGCLVNVCELGGQVLE